MPHIHRDPTCRKQFLLSLRVELIILGRSPTVYANRQHKVVLGEATLKNQAGSLHLSLSYNCAMKHQPMPNIGTVTSLFNIVQEVASYLYRAAVLIMNVI